MNLPIITQSGGMVLAVETWKDVNTILADCGNGQQSYCGRYPTPERASEVLAAMVKHFTEQPVEATWTWTSGASGEPHAERRIFWYTMPKE